ncbi:ABC transporter permease [Dinghuibacter silviterrae]|uniref:Putative permease n=1 Tax=Dinghuibacter silviterrae TaxID=1539049 RepID=A0A4R8DW77_9BACT|nr:ABC transporter permease [Dinghuibacter silviterrae]TDX01745.1 putative permease [Dinghuibacter silviterrae]
MFKTYFLTSWRHLLRNKGYAIINVLGLTLGIACSILIFVLIRYHSSFDTFHPEADRIYRIITEFHDEGVTRNAAVPIPLGKAFRNDYVYAEKVARVVFYPNTLVALPGRAPLRKFQEQNGVAFAEPEYFDIFNFPTVEGSARAAMSDPYGALITQTLARKYFGKEEAVGQRLRFNNQTDYVVRGVLKDLPGNTDRRQEIYLSWASYKDYQPYLASDSSWGAVYGGSNCFIRLKPGVTPAQVEGAFPALSRKYYSPDDARIYQFRLQPIRDVHFNTDLDGTADRRYLWAAGFIGLFLIVTASINFINLATAQALIRSREVGVRKVLGSEPLDVFRQFMLETGLITFAALLLAVGLAYLGLPTLNRLLKVHIDMNLFGSWTLGAYLLLILAVVVLLAGSYPGFVLARFQPIPALKGKLDQKHIGGFSLRRVLVVFQFSISQLLIIGCLVIARQIWYSEHADLGFVKDGVVTVPLPVSDPVKARTLRERFLDIPGVERVSLCFQPPASAANNATDITLAGRPKPENWAVSQKYADDQYVPLFGLKLVAGRNLFPSDTVDGFVINVTTVNKLQAGTPAELIGHQLTVDGTVKAPIVGVVKDFNSLSFYGDMAPVVVYTHPRDYRTCALLLRTGHVAPVLASMERIWNDTYPEYVYSHQFLDERIARFYELDDMLLTLIEFFAGIAIFIGCLGLYGLVSFMAVRKTKEIGVRKVLGAGTPQILWLFGRELSRLIGIAFLLAAPTGWWFMHRYLESFRYRITIGWSVFVPALAGTLVIAALTVGYRSWKASSVKPVENLRSTE